MVQGDFTRETLAHEYTGAGIEEDRYLIFSLENEPGDPMR